MQNYLTFKLLTELFTILYKNKLYSYDIKLEIYNSKYNEYYYKTILNLNDIITYYDENDSMGITSIKAFKCNSDVFNFETFFNVTNICLSNFEIQMGLDFDNEKKEKRNADTLRQKKYLNEHIIQYCKYLNDIKQIFKIGIYSYKYAIPGWSEGTLELYNFYQRSLNENIFMK